VDALRASLDRLEMERVDLYQIHWIDETGMSLERQWEGMAQAQDQALAGYIGVSNFDREQIERCRAIREVQSTQNQLSLLHRDDRAELLPWLEQEGIGYLAYGPLAFGLLTGTMTKETTFGSDDWRGGGRFEVDYYEGLFAPGAFERSLDRVERLRPVAQKHGLDLPSLALAWVIQTAGVTAAIAGSRNPKHVRDNARAGAVRLTDEALKEIEAALA